jgi:hypothetical protein
MSPIGLCAASDRQAMARCYCWVARTLALWKIAVAGDGNCRSEKVDIGRYAPRSFGEMGIAMTCWPDCRARRLLLRRFRQAAPLFRALLAAVLLTVFCEPVAALVVASAGDHATPPADDPGWNNVTTAGRNFVYLGDCWALSARHVGPTTNEGQTLTFSTGTYDLIPGQNFVVPNPAGSGYSALTDLRLVRLKADPGLPSRTIASAAPSIDNQVTIVTQGNQRVADLSNWDVNTSVTPWTWTEVTSGGDYHGYKSTSPKAKRWGTNKIARSSSVFASEDVLSNVRGLVTLSGYDVVSLATTFDTSGATVDEAQAIAGDSGGALFRKNGAQWELAGILDAVFVYSGQSSSNAVYGDATTYVDLSYYHNEIQSILDAHAGYSIMGDINLDGTIWDGLGDPTLDPDIAAFVDGWMAYDYGTGQGDIASWKQGDLNLDGTTNLNDFLLLREALNGAGAGSMTSLLGIGGGIAGVPEPASVVLVLIGMTFLLIFRR